MYVCVGDDAGPLVGHEKNIRLGDADGQATPSPWEFASVSAGSWHACGVQGDGAVACWGSDYYGEATPPAGEFASVSAGRSHTCGVQVDGAVACWGWR